MQQRSRTELAREPVGPPRFASKSIGDIESVQLSLETNDLVLQIRTVAAPPDVLPVAELVFVLSMDEENGYELSAVGLPGWTGGVMWGSTSLYDIATTQHKGLSEKPSATGSALRMAVPLTQMPKWKQPFRWKVRSERRKNGELFMDWVPEAGDDPLNPEQLQFPPETQ